LARFSSAFSRRCRFNSADSSEVVPGRCPSSAWAWRIHLRSVSLLTPSLCATDVIAAHSVSCSGIASATRRIARARKSAEYLLGRAMTPSPHGLEPPPNPGRCTFMTWPLALGRDVPAPSALWHHGFGRQLLDALNTLTRTAVPGEPADSRTNRRSAWSGAAGWRRKSRTSGSRRARVRSERQQRCGRPRTKAA
jgi:hypothetical protein